MKVTLTQQASPSDDVLFQVVGGEAVLLNLASESYFGLDSVGTRVWALLSENPSIQQTYARMLDEYAVEPSQLETDLLDLIAELADAGLVQVT